MSWITFALLAPLFSTATNYIDKYMIGDRIKNPQVLAIAMAIMSLIAGTIAWMLNGFLLLSPTDAALVLGAGVISFFSWVYYFKALEYEETSIVILLFQASPVATLILSWLFLNETISQQQLFGFILILAATTAVSLRDAESNSLKIAPSFWLVNISNILWAISAVMLKFSINTESLIHVLPYEGWGLALGGVILLIINPTVRKSFKEESRKLQKSTLAYIFGNEGIALASRWITILAFSLGPVALVDVVVGVQVFYGIALGFVLTHLFPKVFNEDTSKAGLTLKITSAIALFYGIYLLA